jgi:hypothetical protein
MKLAKRKNSQKGATKMGFVLIGALLMIGFIILVGYFQDHDRYGNHDWHIHWPHVEVH